MKRYEVDIAASKEALKISDAEFTRLPGEQSASAIAAIEQRFVDGPNWYWWWEHLHEMDYAAFHTKDAGYLWLHQILPEPEASVWFVVQRDGERKPFSIYVARARHIQPVVEECIGFEYYVVAKDLSWLLGENHHGCFFCVGEPITLRLQSLVKAHPEQWRSASMIELDPDELSPQNFPKGASILRDEFYWDCTDENSPLGNDTGSDVFYAYLEWQAEHPRANPIPFFSALLEGWGVANEDWELSGPEEVAQSLNSDTSSFLTRDDAIIGLAFAQIVVTGKMYPEVQKRAQLAVERQLQPDVVAARVGASSPFDWVEKLGKMKQVLAHGGAG